MSLTSRPWRGWEDLAPMQRLLSATFDPPDGRWLSHPGDLAWALGWFPKTHDELAASVMLWEADGELAGWAVLDGESMWEAAPGPADDAIDAWAERLPVTRYVRDDDERAIERLVARGYRPVADDVARVFRRRLDDVGGVPDPTVVDLGLDDDPRPRLSVTHAAFGVSKPFEGYVEAYASFMRTPAYPLGWDLVRMTGEGRPAACTIAWPDPWSLVGLFEPVATHPDLQRRGHGAALLREGMRRLAAAGMRAAVVRTPVTNTAAAALYRSVGFIQVCAEVGYRRA